MLSRRIGTSTPGYILRISFVAVLVLAGALALACGASSPSADPAANPAAGSPAKPIKLGFSAWPGWFPWQVAEEAGIFKQVGVNVELVWFEGYIDSINALAGGQLDANSQTLNDTLASVAAGSSQVIVLTNDNSTGNDQIIAAEGIKTIQDLKGKRIGVEVGVVDHFLLLLGLRSAGLSQADVTIVNLETGAAAAAFAAGQLDAVGVFAPFTTQALKRPGSHVVFTSKDFPGAIPDHLAVSAALIKSNPQGVQKLVEAWFKTLDYMKQHPEETLAIRSKRAGVSVAEYQEYDSGTRLFSVEDNVKAFGPGNDYTSLQYAAQEISKFLVDSKFVEAAPNLTGLFDPQFVQAYAKAAK
ncbi:MAG TPA: ABC transporter substrate-binding protein [Dehalococcoidia bacterium]|nr:ABC transporter substrate-binding protein [Dehalococcoidia bacterium]